MTYAVDITECGNLTGSGSGSFPISYFLQNDINVGSGGSYEILVEEPLEYCFMINGSHVILDCQGHTINTDVDIGILVTDDNFLSTQTGIQINNCTIKNTNFGGVYTYEAEEVFITNSTFENNGRTELRGDLLSCTGGVNILRGEPDEPYYNFIAYNTFVNNTMGICLNGRDTDGVQNTIIRNNTISESRAAGLVLVEGTRSNEIYNTTIFNNPYGIFISDAPFNDFEDLNVSNNKYADIMGDPVFEEDGFCTNDFEDVIVTGGNNLFVVENPGAVLNPTLLEGMGIFDAVIPSTQLIICNDNITIEDVYMQGDPTYRNNGLFVMGEGRAYNITINNLTATNLMAGVYAQLARNITIQNSTFENNQYGIIFNSVKKGIFSHNVFNENTAAGIFGTTSPAYYFYFGLGFQPEYFYQVSDLLISENEFTNTGYGPSMREAFPTMSGVPGGFITHFIDMGTGSAIQLLLTKNVTISENTINNASTYGIYAFYTSETNFTNNTITLVNNITEFDPYLLEFESPEYETMVTQLKDMLASMPGTGIYLDGTNMFTYENVISNNVKGLVSSPVSYVVDVMLTTEFLPELKNYIVNNEFSGSDIGLYLAGSFGDVVYHNKFLNYEYGVQVLSANNVVVDNMFNTTDYYLPFNGSLLNTYNASEITAENFIVPFDRNILRGENIGGNYWGNLLGTGFSDICDDIDPVDGFCDFEFELNTTNNTDYKPLAFFSVIDCIDDFECWLSVDFGDGFFCNLETECEECVPACDEDEQCVYDPVLDEGFCQAIVQECIDLDDVKISPDGNITKILQTSMVMLDITMVPSILIIIQQYVKKHITLK